MNLLNAEGLGTFKTMFISIVLEALPFLLLGVFVSSIMQAFIPESWIQRIIPRNALLGVAVASTINPPDDPYVYPYFDNFDKLAGEA